MSAANKQNIGKIVRVLRAYDGTGDIFLVGTGPQWLVQCSVPIVWGWPGKKPTHRRKVGPALDSQLQPIRDDGQRGACSKTQKSRIAAGEVAPARGTAPAAAHQREFWFE